MSLDTINTVSTAPGFSRLVDLDGGALPDLIARLLRDARRAARQDRREAEQRVSEALELVRREGERLLDGAAPVHHQGGLAPWQVRRVDAYLDQHLDGPMRVSDLAAEAKLSVGYFSKAFAVSYGRGAREHIVLRRLERARRMMLGSREPLGQIAVACGFADQAHLSNRFRQVFDTSPNAWRRQQRAAA